MSRDDVTPGVVEEPVSRPGHALGTARERAGISLKEMASRLHLPGDQVRALENDDYSRLPPPAYVRGYLRAYARELGMEPGPLLAGYEVASGEAEDPELVVQYGIPDPTSRRGPMLALLLVVAVAIAGALAWWLQQSVAVPITMNEEDAAESLESEASGSVQNEVQNEVQDEPVEEANEPAAEPAEPTEPEAPESAANDAATDFDTAESAGGAVEETDLAATEGSADEDGSVSGSDGDELVDAEAVVEMEESVGERMLAEGDSPPATSQAEEVGTEAAGEGPDRLRIEVDGESWLEVFDARGRQLAYTLYSGEDPVVLNGWAPFDVFLGNAPDVVLQFGDDLELDHSAFVRSDNTARFMADAEGARRR